MHAALWEAVRAGLVFRQESAYKFLHDRIQQAAYSLIPEEQRAEVHLRIGRVLLASMTADELAEHLFDVANQFNRGAARLVDRDEKAQVATIDLRAGRKAKASAAYASACVYLVGRHGAARRKRLGQPVRINVRPVARTRGVRVSDRTAGIGRSPALVAVDPRAHHR